MPIDAFLRAATKMQASVQDMVKQGVITRAPKDKVTATVAKTPGPAKA
jgi:hypothetical protein